ncbi:aminotransferase class I/II-fold pyridoxal phosphate-dependent enzyme [Ornithinibacillus californiensis]|uniref:aminotransferase class I/II-fold pyridoxal phosphate-dependent enzyme n=1 Tax=Ornithinibacillus californiensis TaxID=161536 RepID=UPI00069D712E|nr:aminotransferase class I/II-fold pyridoxal phosphate-dependent enzyme [Ornithinibacillus californiensis]
MNHQAMPLLQQLVDVKNHKPVSFHVPGHKSGEIFSEVAKPYFKSILPIDLTEITGLDDLHAPQGVIKDAQDLAADYFGAAHTFFLVGGSTAGNLAMILAACKPGDKIIVQRNSHKSIMNGLELSGAKPIFISPEYDSSVHRYTAPSFQTIQQAICNHPEAKGLVLTYPDYFGNTYDIKQIIDFSHQHQIPVLVDEAHGVHFSLGDPLPKSALALGADVVVQSAHKMAPAMTMASLLHIQSDLISKDSIAHYLQLIQSSSPSYPLMASLDVARHYLANLSNEELNAISESTTKLKQTFQLGMHWRVLQGDDPLKITLHVVDGLSGYEVAKHFEKHHVYPELATEKQVLFIHGLHVFQEFSLVEKIVKSINEQYKYKSNHATIEISKLFKEPIQELAVSYHEMLYLPKKKVQINQAIGLIAAEAIIPYPPGIPIILKGERITDEQTKLIQHLIQQGATIQHQDIEQGIQVFLKENNT